MKIEINIETETMAKEVTLKIERIISKAQIEDKDKKDLIETINSITIKAVDAL